MSRSQEFATSERHERSNGPMEFTIGGNFLGGNVDVNDAPIGRAAEMVISNMLNRY